MAYIPIATTTVGSGGASSIDFQSIPSTYTDLVIKLSARADQDTVTAYVKFNNTTANRSNRMLYGNGSSAGSESLGTEMYSYGSVVKSPATSNTFSNVEYYIPNYAGSNNKSMSIDSVNEDNATMAYASLVASLWSDTTAINRVTIYLSGANFVQYSTATLYGIKQS